MRHLLIAALCACAAFAARPAGAATVYRWTDANGVLHFSDSPPPHAAQLQAQNLPDPPPTIAASPANAAEPGDGNGSAGPAQVVVMDHHEEAVAPGTQSLRGTVKNQGGAEARDVYVAVVVTEPNQGAECLREEIDVEPATLAPGAEGSYEAELNNPCFHGPTTADLRAEWR